MNKIIFCYLLFLSTNAYSMRSDLEKNISENLIFKSPDQDKLRSKFEGSRIHSNREHFTKNLVSVHIRPQSQTINYTNDAINGNFDVSASSGIAATIEWSHNSYNKIQLITGIDVSLMDYQDNATLASKNISFLSEKLFGFYAGARYYINYKWNLYSKFSLAESHYIIFKNVNSISSPVLSRFTVPKFYIGVEGMLYQSENWRFNIDSRVLALTNLTKSLANFEVSQGFGFHADVAFRYWVSNKTWMRTSFYMESLTTDVSGDGYTASQGSITSGVALEIGIRI
ncbi:MAG: hypothetical protein HN576_14490 [Bacteriovoracaceae bacterium]|jgi:hypothetical protein|nr:hypothetical protein [Bacteriovoracaceae bacterium]